MQPSLSTVTAVLDLSGIEQIQSNLPSPFIHLSPINTPQAQIATPIQLTKINQIYPQLTISYLQKNIQITVDRRQQVLLITVTDTSASRAAIIANYLARNFIMGQITRLHAQLARYTSWLKKELPALKLDVTHLQHNLHQYPRATNYQQHTLQLEEHRLYTYQATLNDLQDTNILLQQSYELIQPARIDRALTTQPADRDMIFIISFLAGEGILLSILIGLEYQTPLIRHAAELERLTHTPLLLSISRKSLRQANLINWQLALRALTSSRKPGSIGLTLLFAGNQRKVTIAGHLASYLASQGQRTLLVNNFPSAEIPDYHRSPLQLFTRIAFSHIYYTIQPSLFILKHHPYTPLASLNLLLILPELQQMFDWIIVAAPSMSEPETRLLATRATRTWLIVSKRRDRLEEIQTARDFCQRHAVQHDYLFWSPV